MSVCVNDEDTLNSTSRPIGEEVGWDINRASMAEIMEKKDRKKTKPHHSGPLLTGKEVKFHLL